jgi:hypothetical protein
VSVDLAVLLRRSCAHAPALRNGAAGAGSVRVMIRIPVASDALPLPLLRAPDPSD